jgi:hypothetical protein
MGWLGAVEGKEEALFGSHRVESVKKPDIL